MVNSGSLGTTNCTHFLSSANRATTHTNSETIDSGVNESLGLTASDDITTDDVQIGVVGSQVLDHVQLINRVSLRGINDDNVNTCGNQALDTFFVSLAGSDGGTTHQMSFLINGGQGEIFLSHQISSGHQGDQLVALIDNGKFTLLTFLQDFLALGQIVRFVSGDQICGHNFAQGGIDISDEINITTGNKSQKFATHLSTICDGNTTEAHVFSNLQHISDGMVRT
mmetsp:Transcript_45312/g.52088  ORF Transcript_45312/g.52088 Transcript_45312/m.52088 type:complete len:225 (-) Transcript_45312:393-1067(-)